MPSTESSLLALHREGVKGKSEAAGEARKKRHWAIGSVLISKSTNQGLRNSLDIERFQRRRRSHSWKQLQARAVSGTGTNRSLDIESLLGVALNCRSLDIENLQRVRWPRTGQQGVVEADGSKAALSTTQSLSHSLDIEGCHRHKLTSSEDKKGLITCQKSINRLKNRLT